MSDLSVGVRIRESLHPLMADRELSSRPLAKFRFQRWKSSLKGDAGDALRKAREIKTNIRHCWAPMIPSKSKNCVQPKTELRRLRQDVYI